MTSSTVEPSTSSEAGPFSDRVAPFFALAFGVTWALQIPGVLAQEGLLPGDPAAYLPFAMLGIFGPLVAAVILSAREGGRPAVRALFASLLRWRVHPLLYVAALALPAGLLSLGLLGMRSAGYEGALAYPPAAAQLPVIAVIAVAEEVGWRGYALPRLTRRYGAFVASVVIGVAWTAWHIPMFLGQGVPLDTLPVMLLFFVGGSLWFTWLVRRGGGSVLLAVLAHAGAHLNNSHASLPEDSLPLLVAAVVYACLGLGVARLDRVTFPWLRRSR